VNSNQPSHKGNSRFTLYYTDSLSITIVFLVSLSFLTQYHPVLTTLVSVELLFHIARYYQFIMQNSQSYFPSHNFPEAVLRTEASAYKYPVLGHPAPYSVLAKNRMKAQKWMRWPLLLVYGLSIALLSGTIGGFIGKTISSSHVESIPDTNITTPTNTSSSDNSSHILPLPSTGCTPVSQRKYISSKSAFLAIPYTTVCATRWTDSQLAALSAATPSDCIEACDSYNTPANKGKPCLGASFVPSWWNQTVAMEKKNNPFNCFLMDKNTHLARNDQGFEIVALCMKNACDGLVN
jgi:hypothetical protein